MLRIVITGPESAGKTTLALQLAAHYQVPWVPEYARVYLKSIQRDYEYPDLLEIAKGQIYREDRIGAGNPALLICDTDLLTIKIWSDFKYQQTDPWILKHLDTRHYDHYFLCYPDIPWEPDPLREHPRQRQELFTIYQQQLQVFSKPFTEIKGDAGSRMQQARFVIDQLLRQHR